MSSSITVGVPQFEVPSGRVDVNLTSFSSLSIAGNHTTSVHSIYSFQDLAANVPLPPSPNPSTLAASPSSKPRTRAGRSGSLSSRRAAQGSKIPSIDLSLCSNLTLEEEPKPPSSSFSSDSDLTPTVLFHDVIGSANANTNANADTIPTSATPPRSTLTTSTPSSPWWLYAGKLSPTPHIFPPPSPLGPNPTPGKCAAPTLNAITQFGDFGLISPIKARWAQDGDNGDESFGTEGETSGLFEKGVLSPFEKGGSVSDELRGTERRRWNASDETGQSSTESSPTKASSSSWDAQMLSSPFGNHKSLSMNGPVGFGSPFKSPGKSPNMFTFPSHASTPSSHGSPRNSSPSPSPVVRRSSAFVLGDVGGNVSPLRAKKVQGRKIDYFESPEHLVAGEREEGVVGGLRLKAQVLDGTMGGGKMDGDA
ncbi:hypothetical protein BT69DRAFT_1320269 [Atractiella rhizophila]|nr:hypothetical protein BT69DRAFT_1320269 [Atractiella rhizophila]